ncbi:MAG TPA: fumarylacetoacetate hydrolase family protein [Gemmataceae bacterium]|nr:fumarylacetoacetate hydrolase family protein [Gemmataceae bacterium]
MQLCKLRRATGEAEVGVVSEGQVRFLRRGGTSGPNTLSDFLHADDPAALIAAHLDASRPGVPFDNVQLLPPLDEQEVWAAGVTYKRSREARERESAGAARFYDLVYNAERPELFFKATPRRVVAPGSAVRIRQDSRWNVPEPELTLVVSPRMKIVGYTIGNDMSSRDIEGENPLYLPQAKLYNGSCALGPAITLAGGLPAAEQVIIRLTITRGGSVAFDGSTSLAAMKRSFEDLVSWLGRDNDFPGGILLLTGTGIVPPDDFTLAHGDAIAIDITGIGCLNNRVE